MRHAQMLNVKLVNLNGGSFKQRIRNCPSQVMCERLWSSS